MPIARAALFPSLSLYFCLVKLSASYACSRTSVSKLVSQEKIDRFAVP